ncbi:energy-coupling factor transporter transmembrane component T family protein [Rothia santali]
MDVLDSAPGARSALGRVNAGTKILLVAVLTAAFLLSADWVTSATGLLLLMLLTAAAGMNPARLLARLWPILTAAVLGGWATALLADKAGPVVVDLGVTVLTTGSLEAGVAIALRSATLALASVLLLTTTDASEIGQALAQTFRLPARFVLAAVAALRLVGTMVTEWGTLASARRARALGGAAGRAAARADGPVRRRRAARLRADRPGAAPRGPALGDHGGARLRLRSPHLARPAALRSRGPPGGGPRPRGPGGGHRGVRAERPLPDDLRRLRAGGGRVELALRHGPSPPH